MKSLILSLLSSIFLFSCSSNVAQNLFEEHKDAIFKVYAGSQLTAGGTGFLIKTKDHTHIMTAFHICYEALREGIPAILITLDGTPVGYANIDSYYPQYDLCMVEDIISSNKDIEPLEVSKKFSKELVSTQAMTLGYPSLDEATYYSGLVNGYTKASAILSFDPFIMLDIFVLKTTLTVFPGSSGSPVLNYFGRVIGLVSMSNPTTNQGLIVPVEFIRQVVEQN